MADNVYRLNSEWAHLAMPAECKFTLQPFPSDFSPVTELVWRGKGWWMYDRIYIKRTDGKFKDVSVLLRGCKVTSAREGR